MNVFFCYKTLRTFVTHVRPLRLLRLFLGQTVAVQQQFGTGDSSPSSERGGGRCECVHGAHLTGAGIAGEGGVRVH